MLIFTIVVLISVAYNKSIVSRYYKINFKGVMKMKILKVTWFDGEMEESLKRNNVKYEDLGTIKPYKLSTGALFGVAGGTEYKLLRYTRKNRSRICFIW